MLADQARAKGFPLPLIRDYLNAVIERGPPSAWGKAWRLVFDDDGRFGVNTVGGFVSGDEIDLTPFAAFLNALEPALPSNEDEDKEAIQLATQELFERPEGKKSEVYERLFGPPDRRATPYLKNKFWFTFWTPSRFERKVWKPAREGAGLNPLSKKGRRPKKLT